jgi:hypothetical protein
VETKTTRHLQVAVSTTLIHHTPNYYGPNNIFAISHVAQVLKMVHDFTTPLFINNNTKQLLNGKLRHLGIIKPSLQTCNDKPTKQIVKPNTKNKNKTYRYFHAFGGKKKFIEKTTTKEKMYN